MKKLITWTMSALILMIGFPWLAVTFAGSVGLSIHICVWKLCVL